MKLIVKFNKGEYSPIKDSFKKIFSGKFRWDKKQSWVSDKGYVKASKKMETGEAITFIIECENELNDKFVEFCVNNKLIYQCVDNFDNIDIINVKEESEHKEQLNVKLDRAGNFRLMSQYRKDLTPEFIEKWSELLKVDDDKFNSKKEE